MKIGKNKERTQSRLANAVELQARKHLDGLSPKSRKYLVSSMFMVFTCIALYVIATSLSGSTSQVSVEHIKQLPPVHTASSNTKTFDYGQ